MSKKKGIPIKMIFHARATQFYLFRKNKYLPDIIISHKKHNNYWFSLFFGN